MFIKNNRKIKVEYMDSNFLNSDNSHYSGNFSSTTIPGLPGLAGAKLNIDAARSYVPGISMKGGKIKKKLLSRNLRTRRYPYNGRCLSHYNRKRMIQKKYRTRREKKKKKLTQMRLRDERKN
jgi:hypothetical protein